MNDFIVCIAGGQEVSKIITKNENMRKFTFLLGFILLSMLTINCSKNKGDKVKIVEMTIYPETGYGAAIMSNYMTQPLVFSESDDNRKRLLTNIIFEGLDIHYERGYQYKIKAKKVWMQEPPQDVSSIKYVFIKLISKKKVITKDSEVKFNLYVAPSTVKFIPRFPMEYQSDGTPRVYDALKVRLTVNAGNNWMALTSIEGFDYEEGHEYIISVKKVTHADPYAVKYILLDVLRER